MWQHWEPKGGRNNNKEMQYFKKSVRLESLTDGWQSLLAACYKGCVVGMGDLEFLTTSHPRAALDNRDLRRNQSQSLTSSLFPEEMPALGQSVLLWKMRLILTSN